VPPSRASATRQHIARPPQPVCVFRPARGRAASAAPPFVAILTRTHCVLAGGGRHGKTTSGHYQYRLSLQANVWLKRFTLLSYVPPCIKTGANFGCSMFASTLSRMIANGLIGQHAEHVRTYHARARALHHRHVRARTRARHLSGARPPWARSTRARLHHRHVRAHARHLSGARPPWVGSLHARSARARALHQCHVRARARAAPRRRPPPWACSTTHALPRSCLSHRSSVRRMEARTTSAGSLTPSTSRSCTSASSTSSPGCGFPLGTRTTEPTASLPSSRRRSRLPRGRPRRGTSRRPCSRAARTRMAVPRCCGSSTTTT
jgi:hypothetical protein